MSTILRITLDEKGTITGYIDKTSTSFTEELFQKVFKYLKAFDPALRRRAATYEGDHPFIAESLVAWRREKANERGIPPYFILHQRVLYAIADALPQTEEELLAIPGFGRGKLEKYGKDILKYTTEPVN